MRLTYSHFYIPKYCHYSKPIKGLQGCGVSYRFAFNGKEKENESYGNGNEYDFGARIYDPRLGRWISCDPLALKYPDQTPYNYCVNSPILFIDPDGKEIIVSGVKYVPLQLRTAADIERINKGGDFVQQTMAALDQIYMQADASGCDKVTFLVNTKIAVNIQNNNGEFGFNSDVTTVRDADGVITPVGAHSGEAAMEKSVNITFNSHQAFQFENGAQSPVTALAHELDHGWEAASILESMAKGRTPENNARGLAFDVGSGEENRAVGPGSLEFIVGQPNFEMYRTNYSNDNATFKKFYYVDDPTSQKPSNKVPAAAKTKIDDANAKVGKR